MLGKVPLRFVVEQVGEVDTLAGSGPVFRVYNSMAEDREKGCPHMSIVVHHPMQYVGSDKRGSGECAALPQEILGLARCPNTWRWKRGARVMDTRGLTPGTVIATFNTNGDYHWVQHEHMAHTALYVSRDDKRIVVVHQHSKISKIQRHMYSVGEQANVVQNANNYYVVELK
jgi:hypothetical protein